MRFHNGINCSQFMTCVFTCDTFMFVMFLLTAVRLFCFTPQDKVEFYTHYALQNNFLQQLAEILSLSKPIKLSNSGSLVEQILLRVETPDVRVSILQVLITPVRQRTHTPRTPPTVRPGGSPTLPFLVRSPQPETPSSFIKVVLQFRIVLWFKVVLQFRVVLRLTVV